jgi:chromosome segregation ATPase
MNPDILANLLASVATLVAGAGLAASFKEVLEFWGRRRGKKAKPEIPSFREKMERLSADLARASAEVDKTLQEMTAVSRAREGALSDLESKMGELSKREKELQTRVETLQNVPLPAINYFLEATEKRERRSALRDYILFGLGVIVSTVVTIVLKLAFNI